MIPSCTLPEKMLQLLVYLGKRIMQTLRVFKETFAADSKELCRTGCRIGIDAGVMPAIELPVQDIPGLLENF